MASCKGEHMKTLGYRFVAIAVLAGLSFVSSVWAQAGNAIEFKVTSSFVAGDAKFPAGTYTIRQDPDNQQEWELSNDSKGYSAFLLTDPSSSTTSNQKAEVTFQKYGNTLVLKEIWILGLANGFSVQTSYAEKKVAKAGSSTKVSVAAAKK
jgi:hypothetical protein